MDLNYTKCKHLSFGLNSSTRQYTMGSNTGLHQIGTIDNFIYTKLHGKQTKFWESLTVHLNIWILISCVCCMLVCCRTIITCVRLRRYKEVPPNLFHHSSNIHIMKEYPFLIYLIYKIVISGWISSWLIKLHMAQSTLTRIIFTVNTNPTRSN